MSSASRDLRKRTFAGRIVDTTLLDDEELRLLRIYAGHRLTFQELPKEEQARLRGLAWKWGIGTAVVTALASLIVFGTVGFEGDDGTIALGIVIVAGTLLGPQVAIGVPQLYQQRALERATKAYRIEKVDAHLDEIGFDRRRAKPDRKQRGGRSDGGHRPYWYVDGYDHSRHRGMFTSRDRANMNDWGIDADTYQNNVIEHDPD